MRPDRKKTDALNPVPLAHDTGLYSVAHNVSGVAAVQVSTPCLNREVFVVVGWSDPEGGRHRIGSLLIGYYTPEGKLT
jgi:hypothetical protein